MRPAAISICPQSMWGFARQMLLGQPYRMLSVLAALAVSIAFSSGAWPPLFHWMPGVHAIPVLQLIGWVAASLAAQTRQTQAAINRGPAQQMRLMKTWVADQSRSLDVAIAHFSRSARIADTCSIVLIAGYWLGNLLWPMSP